MFQSMPIINKKLISDFRESQELLIRQAIQQKIPLYIMDTANNQYFQLSPGNIEDIRKNNSRKKLTRIYIRSPKQTNYGMDHGHWMNDINYSNIWVDNDLAENLIKQVNGNGINYNESCLSYPITIQAAMAAYDIFWKPYDPISSDKSRPTSKVIKEWLRNKYNFNEEMSKRIDQLIRPSEYNKGGNTKLKKSRK